MVYFITVQFHRVKSNIQGHFYMNVFFFVRLNIKKSVCQCILNISENVSVINKVFVAIRAM